MLTAWILFSFLVTGIVAAGARVLEAASEEAGGATRWPWIAGIAIALILSTAALIPSIPSAAALLGAPDAVHAPVSDGNPPPGAFTSVLPMSMSVAAPGVLDRFDPMVGWLWALAVLFLGLRVAASTLRLTRARESWSRVALPEGDVLVSDDIGPAVCGILRNEVVLPRWCLALSESERDLIVMHEIEHRQSRDTLLVGAGGFAVLLLPWNLPLWWMWTRLRGAVEVDCDARVARRRPGSKRLYGHLLLTVGSRGSGLRSPLATFSQRPSILSRRIHMLTRRTSRFSIPRSLILAGGGALLVAVACLVPGPDRSDGITDPLSESSETPAPATDVVASSPEFTPHDVAPRNVNPEVVARTLERLYPPLLRDNGIGGTMLAMFHIDADGSVLDARVAETSGHQALDDAALEAAFAFRFSPAENQGEPVPVWVQVPITFESRGAASPGDEEAVAAARAEDEMEAARDSEVASSTQVGGPSFTPHDTPPRMTNEAEVSSRLSEAYPAILRDNGIGGTVLLHVYVDAGGSVLDMEIAERSGHGDLDAAALQVAAVFDFEPALNRGEAVPVWIQVPVSFAAR